MRASMLGIVFVLPFLAVLLAVPVLIGVYVYRDASRRGMNAVLWTLIAVLAPMFIGFILYLLVRGGHPDLQCARCGAPVAESYAVCPGCGARLRYSCPACGRPAEPEWRVCPYCAAELPPEQPGVTPPERFPDRTLRKVLAAVALVPVLAVFVILALSVSGFSGGGSSSITAMSVQEYKDMTGLAEEIDGLLAGVERSDRAYVLRHVEDGPEQGECRAQYVVYVPLMAQDAGYSYGRSSGLFGDALEVDIDPTDRGGGNTLLLLTSNGRKLPKLRIEYGGKKLGCEMIDVDYNLTPDYEGGGF